MLAVAVTTTLNVPASFKLEPNITTLLPSIYTNNGVAFNVYEIVSLHCGV
jgi:hypothetical protein